MYASKSAIEIEKKSEVNFEIGLENILIHFLALWDMKKFRFHLLIVLNFETLSLLELQKMVTFSEFCIVKIQCRISVSIVFQCSFSGPFQSRVDIFKTLIEKHTIEVILEVEKSQAIFRIFFRVHPQ